MQTFDRIDAISVEVQTVGRDLRRDLRALVELFRTGFQHCCC